VTTASYQVNVFATHTGVAVSHTATSGAGGNGIPSGIAGDSTGGNNSTGGVGSSSVGGVSASSSDQDSKLLLWNGISIGLTVNCSSEAAGGGGGGSATGGGSSSGSSSSSGGVIADDKVSEKTASGGLAGYAFVGGNITVYNTNSAKLKDGRNNGAGYTLVSV
jgi:hypothetical protein